MIALMLTLMLQVPAGAHAHTPPSMLPTSSQPRMQCTPALVARATPAGWASPRAVADGGRLEVGRASTVVLVPGKTFVVAPAKPAAAGVALSVVVPRAARWRISLASGAWIDMVRGGAAIGSVEHGRGTPCSGVRKQVDFDLAPGRYVLQLSGAAGAPVRVMVSPT